MTLPVRCRVEGLRGPAVMAASPQSERLHPSVNCNAFSLPELCIMLLMIVFNTDIDRTIRGRGAYC